MSALSDLWIAEVAADVFRIGTGYVGWYLIHERGRYTAVDSGLPGHWGQLTRFLASRGSAIGDIDAQLLTHHHVDHRGNAERVRTEADAVVMIHADDARQAGERPPPVRGPMWRPALLRYGGHMLRHGVLRTRPVLEVSTFDDGERLDVPGRPQVIHVPGHTAGHCCIYLEDKRALIVGDALVGIDLFTGRVGPRIPPSFLNEDGGLALRSLSRIERLDADQVLPVHGPAWTGPVAEAVRLARQVGIY